MCHMPCDMVIETTILLILLVHVDVKELAKPICLLRWLDLIAIIVTIVGVPVLQ